MIGTDINLTTHAGTITNYPPRPWITIHKLAQLYLTLCASKVQMSGFIHHLVLWKVKDISNLKYTYPRLRIMINMFLSNVGNESQLKQSLSIVLKHSCQVSSVYQSRVALYWLRLVCKGLSFKASNWSIRGGTQWSSNSFTKPQKTCPKHGRGTN